MADEHGVGASDLGVEAWDISVSGGKLLGADTTDARGTYSIDYDPAILEGKWFADLEIRALDPRGEEAELGRSAVTYQAGPQTVTDLIVADAAVERTPDFDRLRTTLEPFLGDHTLDTLDPDGVSYLAERSGWDARTVVMAAQSVRLAAGPAVDAADRRDVCPVDRDSCAARSSRP